MSRAAAGLIASAIAAARKSLSIVVALLQRGRLTTWGLGQPKWQTCWQSDRIQPRLSERSGRSLVRRRSRGNGQDGQDQSNRLLRHLCPTDWPRGQTNN